MTPLMRLVYEYTEAHRVAGYIDRQAYRELENLEEKALAKLKDGLSDEQLGALERYQDACAEQHFIDQEAMFQATFSVARELRV